MKEKKKWGLIILGIFLVFIMMASILSINSSEEQPTEDLELTLCEAANHSIVVEGEVLTPCEEGQYNNCWDCINNRINIR